MTGDDSLGGDLWYEPNSGSCIVLHRLPGPGILSTQLPLVDDMVLHFLDVLEY